MVEGKWGFKVIPTWHPAFILRTWSARPVGLLDLLKVKQECEFPEVIRPHREIWIEPDIEDMLNFERLYFRKGVPMGVDIETKFNQLITCVSFAPDAENGITIAFVDLAKPGWHYWEDPNDEVTAWQIVARWLREYISLGQNFLYDVQYLWRDGCPPLQFEEDTLLLHHAYSPESVKDLGFQISIYTNEQASKTLAPRGRKTVKRDD